MRVHHCWSFKHSVTSTRLSSTLLDVEKVLKNVMDVITDDEIKILEAPPEPIRTHNMARFESTCDLTEYFFNVGKNAAKQMIIDSSLLTLTECPALSLDDSLCVPGSVYSREEYVSKSPAQQNSGCRVPKSSAENLTCANVKLSSSHAFQKPSKPVSQPSNGEAPTVRERHKPVIQPLIRESQEFEKKQEPSSLSSNCETPAVEQRREPVTRLVRHQAPAVEKRREPVRCPVTRETSVIEKRHEPVVSRPTNHETPAIKKKHVNVRLPLNSETSSSSAKVWLNLSECLELFVGNQEAVSHGQDIQNDLKHALSDALKTVSSKDITTQTLNIPFDNLVKVCDVFSADGSSTWSRTPAATEAARSILEGKTVQGFCGPCSDAGFMSSSADHRTLDYERRPILVHFHGCEGGGVAPSVEENLLATGTYLRYADGPKLVEDPNKTTVASKGRVLESLTCIDVVDACHFWAYVGSEWPRRLKELDLIYEECDISDDELMGDDGGEIYLTERPKRNDVLLLVAEDASLNEFGVSAVRVQVVDVRHNNVILWCLDFAVYITQKWQLLRRCPKKMAKIPYQAQLCRIEGLVAKPSVELLLKCCALLLTLLTKWTFALKDETLKSFFDIFPPLCFGPVPPLRRPSLLCVCAVASMAVTVSDKRSLVNLDKLVTRYVECIRRICGGVNISDDLEELITATQTVRNLFFSFIELRKHFAQIGGFPVIIQLVLSKDLDSNLEMEIWKLLRVLFGSGDLCKEKLLQHRGAALAQKIAVGSVREKPSSDCPVAILPRRSIKYLLQEQKQAPPVKENGTAPSVTLLRAICSTSSRATRREFLIRGKDFHLRPSDATIVMPQRRMNEIVHLRTIEAVCGLLNSDTGGAIYFGIDSLNKVAGINLGRKQRDEIRIGFDSQFDRYLSPRLSPNSCNLTYIKVFEPNEPKDLDCAQHTLYVVRLEIKASSTSILYKLKSGQYFLIKDGSAKVAITQELREKVIRTTEKQFM